MLLVISLMEFFVAMTIFDCLKDIITEKSSKLPENPDFSKTFNVYMIIRYLSMDKRFSNNIIDIMKLQQILSQEEMYYYLIKIIPKEKNSFIKYITKPKKAKEEKELDE